MMLRYLTTAGLALLAAAGVAFGANIPLLSSTSAYNEPSQIVATLNTLINSINATTDGLLAGIPAAATTSGTSANTILSYSVPPGAIASGQAIVVRGWGVNSADANAKTITLNFGTSAPTVVVTGSGNTWSFDCTIQNVGTVASPSQNIGCKGITGTTNVAASNTNSTQALTSNLTLNVQGTAATAGTMTFNGLTMEVVR